MALAIPIGLSAGLVGYGFTWLVGRATAELWTAHTDNGFLDGRLWWIALMVAGGVVVGLLRRGLRIPAEPAGALENITERNVDQRSALPMILVSFVSLSSGASLGPFDAGTRGGAEGGQCWLRLVGHEARSGTEGTIPTVPRLAGSCTAAPSRSG